ncbi:MAG: glucose 1-dehydrogenase [Myxococcota bacterium]
MTQMKNKVALVTGGARDIGGAISLALAEAGCNVVVNYQNSQAQAEATVESIRKLGRKAVAVKADITKATEVDALIQRTMQALGKEIHVLVNCAGGLVARKRVEEMDEAFYDAVMDINLRSTFLVTQAVLPHMPEGGAVVNVASQAARDGGGAGAILYATAKGAVVTFTRGLAKELGPRRIRVNAVAPGMINTLFHEKFTKPEVRQKVAGATPLGREGQSMEVARLVTFLASDEASFVNGACVDVNGGAYLG